MHYAILCYHDEGAVGALTREEDDALMAELAVVRQRLCAEGKLGPVARGPAQPSDAGIPTDMVGASLPW